MRGGFDAPENWTDSYYRALAGKVLSTGGVLSKTRLTEYARVILGLTAIGEDPANVAGYHLLAALSDYDAATQPGVTSAAYVLLALDCGNYEIPKTEAGKTQATREMYVDFMLGKQLSDGGWAIGAEEADPDVTAMVLQALAPYQSNTAVKNAVSLGVQRPVQTAERRRRLHLLGLHQLRVLLAGCFDALRAGDFHGRQPLCEKRS